MSNFRDDDVTSTSKFDPPSEQPMTNMYPLGRNIFATVRAWRGAVRVHVRDYIRPTATKGGKLIPSRKGIALTLIELERLVYVKNYLKRDFENLEQSSSSVDNIDRKKSLQNTRPSNDWRGPPSAIPYPVQQVVNSDNRSGTGWRPLPPAASLQHNADPRQRLEQHEIQFDQPSSNYNNWATSTSDFAHNNNNNNFPTLGGGGGGGFEYPPSLGMD